MADTEARLGHCPKCGPDRSAEVVGKHHKHHDDDESDAWVDIDYRILQCRGCASVYFQEAMISSEDPELVAVLIDGREQLTLPERVTHWPPPLVRPKPAWCSKPDFIFANRILSRLLDDVYGTLNADLKVPAAVSARTAFDAASEQLGIDAVRTFSQKLDALTTQGRIGQDERQVLEVLVEAGSAAVHRGWEPNLEQLDTIVSILEDFLHRTFVLRQKADGLRKAVPAKRRAKKSP